MGQFQNQANEFQLSLSDLCVFLGVLSVKMVLNAETAEIYAEIGEGLFFAEAFLTDLNSN